MTGSHQKSIKAQPQYKNIEREKVVRIAKETVGKTKRVVRNERTKSCVMITAGAIALGLNTAEGNVIGIGAGSAAVVCGDLLFKRSIHK